MKTKHILKIAGLISAITTFTFLVSCDEDSASVSSLDQDITGITETEQRTFYLRSDNVEVVAEGNITSLIEEGGEFLNDGTTDHEFTVNLGDGDGEIVFADQTFSNGSIDADGNFSYRIDRSRVGASDTEGVTGEFTVEDIATVSGRFGYRESDLKLIGVARETRNQKVKDANGNILAEYKIEADLLLEVKSGISAFEPPSTSSIIYSWIRGAIIDAIRDEDSSPIYQIKNESCACGIRG